MLASRPSTSTSHSRDAWIEVDLGLLEQNVQTVRSWLNEGTELMGVVKSDAYGHGAPAVAPVIVAAGARSLGVASVDEGRQLRAAGIKVPILILGPSPSWAIAEALNNDLQFTITSESQLRDLAAEARRHSKVASVHIKVDTGMHRLGVNPKHVLNLVELIESEPFLKLSGLFSHLARASDETAALKQDSTFQTTVKLLIEKGKVPDRVHLSSGQAAQKFPQLNYDMVRVGLYLYGLEPKEESKLVMPCMSVRGRICHIGEIESGESAGYDWTWTSERYSRLALVPIGYADGVDRRLSNRMTALLMGKTVKQVGLINMDSMLFDITDVPEAQVGDIVTLIGADVTSNQAAPKSIALASWASMLDTITYELCCRLRARLPRIYTRRKTSA